MLSKAISCVNSKKFSEAHPQLIKRAFPAIFNEAPAPDKKLISELYSSINRHAELRGESTILWELEQRVKGMRLRGVAQ